MKLKIIFLIFILIFIQFSFEVNEELRNKRRREKANRNYKRQKSKEKSEKLVEEKAQICSCHRKIYYSFQKINDSEFYYEFKNNSGNLNLLGEGGTAKVYHVYSFEKNKCYAAKKFKEIEYFEKEKKFYKDLNERVTEKNLKQNIINLINYNENNNTIFMEIADMDLKEYIKNKKEKLTENEFLKEVYPLIKKIILVIINFHDVAVHLDLKPQNILIIDGEPRLSDFGFSQLKIKLNDERNYYGTFQFMSPEVAINGLQSKNATKADIWALGIIIFQMLFGFDKYPYTVVDNEHQQIVFLINQNSENFKQLVYSNILKIKNEYYNINNSLTDEIIKVIKNCLTSNPEDRQEAYQLINLMN